MLHFVEGDILKSDADAIVHGLAANDPMDQGLCRGSQPASAAWPGVKWSR